MMRWSVCWALVGWCHLGSANKLLQKFLSLYAAPNLAAMGLRALSLAEAEAADAEMCRQLNLLMSRGVSERRGKPGKCHAFQKGMQVPT